MKPKLRILPISKSTYNREAARQRVNLATIQSTSSILLTNPVGWKKVYDWTDTEMARLLRATK